MRRSLALLITILGCGPGAEVRAQSPSSRTVVGTWRGTSLCLVRPSACRDENVVYYINATGTRDSLTMDARKIVNGAEEEMGVLGCRFITATAQLNCQMPNGVWHFTMRSDSLVGELRLPDGRKFRDVRTKRGSPK